MLDSIKMVKLDVLTIKGYAKQMILSYLMITIALITTLPYMLNVVYFVCASSFLIYPFMVSEQNGMDQFYRIVSTTKRARIQSKYLEAIVYLMITIIGLLPVNVMIYMTAEEKPSVYLLVGILLIGVIFYCIVVSIQIPCCFKWGYAKSKVISMILPLVIGFGIPAVGYILIKMMTKESLWQFISKIGNFIAMNTTEILIGSLFIGALSLLVSYKVAFKTYRV